MKKNGKENLMKLKEMELIISGTVLCVFIVMLFSNCRIIIDPAYLMELNRNGKWQQAERVGLALLNNQDTFSYSDICETYFHIIYAKTRQGKKLEAVDFLNKYEKYQQQAPISGSSLWLKREINQLKKELGLKDILYIPDKEDGFWQKANPKELGLNDSAIAGYQILCEETGADANLIIYKGMIVHEWYVTDFSPPVDVMEITQPLAAVLTGILISEGKISSEDDCVSNYLPEWKKGNPLAVSLTLSQLLSMSSGLKLIKDLNSVRAENMNAFILKNLDFTTTPAKMWEYSPESIQLISSVLHKAAGIPLQAYAKRMLFDPLEIKNTWFLQDKGENTWLFTGMHTTPRELAKLGLLLLQNGKWQDKILLKEDWINRMTQPSQQYNPGYGLLWRILNDGKGYGAVGMNNNIFLIFPHYELILIRLQDLFLKEPDDLKERFQYKASQLIKSFFY